MVRRLDKVRKSAILEHLLDLERQIRTELARASIERQAMATTDKAPDVTASNEQATEGRQRPVATEIAQRYLH